MIVISRVKQKVIESYKNKNVNKQAEERKAALRQRGKSTAAAAAQKRNKDLGGNMKMPEVSGSNVSMQAKNKHPIIKAEKKKHWLNLLDEDHAEALISDAFWYVICKICNPKPEFEQHQEFLLEDCRQLCIIYTY